MKKNSNLKSIVLIFYGKVVTFKELLWLFCNIYFEILMHSDYSCFFTFEIVIWVAMILLSNWIVSFQTELHQFAIDTIRRWFEFFRAALLNLERRNRSISIRFIIRIGVFSHFFFVNFMSFFLLHHKSHK